MPQPNQAPHKRLREHKGQHDEHFRRNAPLYRQLLWQALYEGNDAAWDAITPYLRSLALQAIYQRAPDLAPRDAERLAVFTLLNFMEQLGKQSTRTSHFPTDTTLVQWLDQAAEKIIP